MSLLKTKLEQWLHSTEYYFTTCQQLRNYVDYRLTFITKEADKMLEEKKTEAEIQAFIDKCEKPLKPMLDNLSESEAIISSLLEVIDDKEAEKADLVNEIRRLQNRLQYEQYAANEQKPLTWAEREALRARQYQKWHDFH